jgi:hypothetical protein
VVLSDDLLGCGNHICVSAPQVMNIILCDADGLNLKSVPGSVRLKFRFRFACLPCVSLSKVACAYQKWAFRIFGIRIQENMDRDRGHGE